MAAKRKKKFVMTPARAAAIKKAQDARWGAGRKKKPRVQSFPLDAIPKPGKRAAPSLARALMRATRERDMLRRLVAFYIAAEG